MPSTLFLLLHVRCLLWSKKSLEKSLVPLLAPSFSPVISVHILSKQCNGNREISLNINRDSRGAVSSDNKYKGKFFCCCFCYWTYAWWARPSSSNLKGLNRYNQRFDLKNAEPRPHQWITNGTLDAAVSSFNGCSVKISRALWQSNGGLWLAVATP